MDALVAPFVGERYATGTALDDVIAPPYDVISAEQRAGFAKRSPYNIVHLILPSGDGGDRYAHAARLLAQWRKDGVFEQDRRPSVTVVRQEFTTPDGVVRVRTGVIAGVSAEEFGGGRVKPHERTHAGPKEDRLALLRATRSMFEALFLLAPDPDRRLVEALAAATRKKPAATASLNGVKVAVWPVAGRAADGLAGVAGAGGLYVADGHHRYETAVSYRRENPAASRVPALIVPVADPGLVVAAAHRIVQGESVDAEAFVNGLRGRFQVRELPRTANYAEEVTAMRSRGTGAVVVLPGSPALALLLKGGARLGDLPFAQEPALAALDIARVDELIVKRLLQLSGEGASLSYSAASGDVIDRVRGGEAAAGVLVNPTRVEQVLAVADAEVVMPPKATYFVPKVPSGLVGISYE